METFFAQTYAVIQLMCVNLPIHIVTITQASYAVAVSCSWTYTGKDEKQFAGN